MQRRYRRALLAVLVLLSNVSHGTAFRIKRLFSITSTPLSAVKPRSPYFQPVPQPRGIDARNIKGGSIIEYISAKGSKRLALVNRRTGGQVEVLNDVKKMFSVPLYRVTCHIKGTYAFDDLINLLGTLNEFKPAQIERLWEATYGQQVPVICDISYISNQVYGSAEPIQLFSTLRLMSTYGNVFFEEVPLSSPLAQAQPAQDQSQTQAQVQGQQLLDRPSSSSCGLASNTLGNAICNLQYTPLSPSVVQDNLRSRAALKEFKQRYMKIIMSKTQSSRRTPILMPDMPERIVEVLDSYSEGLKHLVIKGHPWVVNGWSRRKVDEKLVGKGRELLEFLELAPAVKNAKKVLEIIGAWPLHTNVEKYVMDLRDAFPPEVLDEAQYLLDNADMIPDPDERLRRDLRHLGCYAIDSEGAAEVDDALSVEYLEDGREKLWIHIADVSRWIRPGSQLSLEAERRMVSVYMPDERISMFPYSLSSELLSLGASVDSYALSCGVTLNDNGDLTSFEVCPSKVRITRRLSYAQLDDILSRAPQPAVGGRKELTQIVANPLITPLAAMADGDDDDDDVDYSDGSRTSDGGELILNDGDNVDDDGSDDDNDEDDDDSSYFSQSGDAGPLRNNMETSMAQDLSRLNYWARVRHQQRIRENALDQYIRHKTELSLNVKRDPKTQKYIVSGYTSWANATSMCLVSECMILMCQTIGVMCQTIGAPVWYKTQVSVPPLSVADLELRPNETPFLRAARLMSHLRTANDSKIPGPHCTSGSQAYVQCTSPIRRYHDLYNHYRLKAAMHGASLGEAWADRAKEEAGIVRLDSMATAEERLQTLNAVRLVTRYREQYWLSLYMEKLIGAASPRHNFDCLVYGPYLENVAPSPSSSPGDDLLAAGASPAQSGDGSGDSSGGAAVDDASSATVTSSVNGVADGVSDLELTSPSESTTFAGQMYNGLILQLGSFTRYRVYSPTPLTRGQLIKCHLYKRYTNPRTYLLLPNKLTIDSLPTALANELLNKKGSSSGSGDSGDADDIRGSGGGSGNSAGGRSSDVDGREVVAGAIPRVPTAQSSSQKEARSETETETGTRTEP